MSVIGKIILLSGILWLTAVLFAIYIWFLLYRQQVLLRLIGRRLTLLENRIKPMPKTPEASDSHPTSEKKKHTEPETQITIDKNEPLSKYETVNLPDEIDINFVDR